MSKHRSKERGNKYRALAVLLYFLSGTAEKDSFRQQEHLPCRKPLTPLFIPVSPHKNKVPKSSNLRISECHINQTDETSH